MNRAILVGRLTKDPQLTTTTSGISTCSFTIAIDRTFKDANGNKQADFIPIVVWRAQADNCGKYLRKGSQCAVSGTIQTRTYDDKKGEKRYVTEVVADNVEFLTRANSEGSTQEDAPRNTIDSLQPVEDENLPF